MVQKVYVTYNEVRCSNSSACSFSRSQTSMPPTTAPPPLVYVPSQSPQIEDTEEAQIQRVQWIGVWLKQQTAGSQTVPSVRRSHSQRLPAKPYDCHRRRRLRPCPHTSVSPTRDHSPLFDLLLTFTTARSFLKRPYAPNIPIQAIGLSLYESLPSRDPAEPTEAPGTKVTRTQWLDLSSLEMSNLVGKNILIVDEVDDTRTTLEYAVRELQKDVETARRNMGGGPETRFSIFVLHVSLTDHFSFSSSA